MSGTELDRLYFTVDADLGPYKDKMKELGGEAEKTGGKLSDHFKKAGDAAHEMHRGIEVSRRELLYFGRELATGDLARLPSTLVLIGSHLAGITSEAILMGGTIGLPFALMATAAYQAEAAINRVNIALAASGGVSGVNSAQISAMAERIGSDPASGLSKRGAIDTGAILARSGNFIGEDSMEGGIRGAGAYSKITGKKVDDGAAEFAKMMKSPGAAAKELHDSLHLLDDAQLQHVLSLKDTGEQQAAIERSLIERNKEVRDSMWSLGKAFDALSDRAANWWQHTGENLNPQKSPEQEYASRMAERSDEVTKQRAGILAPGSLEKWDEESDRLRRKMASDRLNRWQDSQTGIKDEVAEKARSPGAMEVMAHKDAIRVAGMSPADRDVTAAKLAADRQLSLDKFDAVKGPFAQEIHDTAITEAKAQQSEKQRDFYKDLRMSTQAQVELTAAERIGVDAASHAANVSKVAADIYIGRLAPALKGVATALLDKADVEKRIAESDKLIRHTEEQAQAEEDLARATLQGVAAAERQEVASKAAQLVREGTLRPEDRAKYEADTLKAQASGRVTSQENANRKKGESNALLGLEVSLLGVGEEIARRRMAYEKTRLDLLERQIPLDSEAGKNALALADAEAVINQRKEEGVNLQNRQVEAAMKLADAMDLVFSHINEGRDGIRKLGHDMGQFALKNVEELGVMNPVRNAITKGVTGKEGTLPTFFNLAAGKPDGSEGNPLHVVLSEGKKAGAAAGSLWSRIFGHGPSHPSASGAHGAAGAVGHAVHQTLNIHPDVSAVARGEILKMLPQIHSSTLGALGAAIGRGFVPGGIG